MKLAMNLFTLSAAAMEFSTTASATCSGTDSFQTCYDASSGNSYQAQRYGNTTQMNGCKAETGSSWNQTSRTIGNITFHTGTCADGNFWNSTQQEIGVTTVYNGTDSQANSFSCFQSEFFSTC